MINIAPVHSDNGLSLTFYSLGANNWGERIQGSYRIKGIAPSEIVSLSLFFNGTSVQNSTDNEISYVFDTDDYPLGYYNITLIATKNDNSQFLLTTWVEFVPVSYFNFMFILIGCILIAIIGIFILRYYIRRTRINQKPTKNDVRIQNLE